MKQKKTEINQPTEFEKLTWRRIKIAEDNNKSNSSKVPIEFRTCNHCLRQRHVNIHSTKNVFCSYWVEVIPKTHHCTQFSPFTDLFSEDLKLKTIKPKQHKLNI